MGPGCVLPMSAPGGVAVEPEGLDELVLDGGGVGEHAVGPGPAAVAGVEQDGFADAGQLGEQGAHGQVQPGAGGAAAHEVGELEGEHAGEDVDADVVLGPVEHRAEGGGAGVFHLPEGGLGLGLGPVGGDDLGGRPVVMIGDQDMLAEDLLFERGVAILVDVPGEPVVFGGVSGQLPGDDAAGPGVVQDLYDHGFDLGTCPAGLAAGQGGGQVVHLAGGLGQGGAGEAAGLAFVQVG